MATINMLEETANYLLNHCFLLGSVEDQRAKYLYVQDHLDEVRAVFAPLGYSVLLYPAPLQAAALVNGHEGSQARLLKYESILLLVLRLLYLQKRESLAVNAGSGKSNYFLAPHYPINPRMIKFGLSWNFFD